MTDALEPAALGAERTEYQEREIFAYGRYIRCQILNWQEGPPPKYLICNPLGTGYREEFLAHQAMGTWARCDLRHIVADFAALSVPEAGKAVDILAGLKTDIDLLQMAAKAEDPYSELRIRVSDLLAGAQALSNALASVPAPSGAEPAANSPPLPRPWPHLDEGAAPNPERDF